MQKQAKMALAVGGMMVLSGFSVVGPRSEINMIANFADGLANGVAEQLEALSESVPERYQSSTTLDMQVNVPDMMGGGTPMAQMDVQMEVNEKRDSISYPDMRSEGNMSFAMMTKNLTDEQTEGMDMPQMDINAEWKMLDGEMYVKPNELMVDMGVPYMGDFALDGNVLGAWYGGAFDEIFAMLDLPMMELEELMMIINQQNALQSRQAISNVADLIKQNGKMLLPLVPNGKIVLEDGVYKLDVMSDLEKWKKTELAAMKIALEMIQIAMPSEYETAKAEMEKEKMRMEDKTEEDYPKITGMIYQNALGSRVGMDLTITPPYDDALRVMWDKSKENHSLSIKDEDGEGFSYVKMGEEFIIQGDVMEEFVIEGVWGDRNRNFELKTKTGYYDEDFNWVEGAMEVVASGELSRPRARGAWSGEVVGDGFVMMIDTLDIDAPMESFALAMTVMLDEMELMQLELASNVYEIGKLSMNRPTRYASMDVLVEAFEKEMQKMEEAEDAYWESFESDWEPDPFYEEIYEKRQDVIEKMTEGLDVMNDDDWELYSATLDEIWALSDEELLELHAELFGNEEKAGEWQNSIPKRQKYDPRPYNPQDFSSALLELF